MKSNFKPLLATFEGYGPRGIPKSSGIYAIINSSSGRCYLGSSRDLYRRYYHHQRELRGGYHRNEPLQSDFSKDGAANFVFTVLEFCPKQKLIETENRWIPSFVSSGFLYNRDQRAGPGTGKTCEATRAEMSASATELWRDPERRARMSARLKGRVMSARPFALVSPEGVLHTGINRQEFCRKMGLWGSAITRVANGDAPHHKGWTRPKFEIQEIEI